MTEITEEMWWNEAGPEAHGTVRYKVLHKAAEEGKLIVIGNRGERLVPVKFGESWILQPAKQ